MIRIRIIVSLRASKSIRKYLREFRGDLNEVGVSRANWVVVASMIVCYDLLDLSSWGWRFALSSRLNDMHANVS